MKQQVMSILTRTPMHVGAGASVGVVDLPIIRERHTGFPVIPGSSLKGVLAAMWKDKDNLTEDNKRVPYSDAEFLFGKNEGGDNEQEQEQKQVQAQAGNLLVGEAKILAFPVRSAKNAFAWCTCPMVLRRFFRDHQRHDSPDAGRLVSDLPVLGAEQCMASENLIFADGGVSQVVLEEYCLQAESGSAILPALVEHLQKLSSDSIWKDELEQRLVLLSDDMFSYFVQNACEIAHHVKIDLNTRAAQGQALFNQENVPSETMFYTVLVENVGPETSQQKRYKQVDCFSVLTDKLKEEKLIQIGANATTGQGWCSVELIAFV